MSLKLRIRRSCAITLLALAAGAPGALAATGSTRITFYFGLTRPEPPARAAFFAVQQPGSRSYRRFLSARTVARRYGASTRTRDAFVRVARRHGLSARIDPSGVFARVTATVSQFDHVFKVHIKKGFNNDENADFWVLPGSSKLRLPGDMRSLVEDVVPSYSRSSEPGASARSARAQRSRGPRRTGSWTAGCAKAKATGAFSFAQVRHAYGIDQLGAGAGASVAILNVAEGVTGKDIADNAGCFGYPKLTTRTLRIDGQRRPFGPGSFEPEEDLALVRGMAPGLRSLTFTQVWFSAETWFIGAANVLDAPRLPDSLSISYGECERDIRGRGSTPTTRAGANLMDSILVRLGLAGVGSYASAGDFGSTCNGRPFSGVAWPSSSPFVTAVGGTRLTLTRANDRSDEVVWNDLRWTSRKNGGGAGGGGYSAVSPRPPYQRDDGIPGNRRTTPDISAAASNFPGWPVVLGGNWVKDGGTSASAPLIAAAMAVLSADQRRAHRPRLGPVNGLLYYLARCHRTATYDVVRGTNSYLPSVRGRRARRGYDLASGLGVPRFARLASSLPSVR